MSTNLESLQTYSLRHFPTSSLLNTTQSACADQKKANSYSFGATSNIACVAQLGLDMIGFVDQLNRRMQITGPNANQRANNLRPMTPPPSPAHPATPKERERERVTGAFKLIVNLWGARESNWKFKSAPAAGAFWWLRRDAAAVDAT